MTIRCKAAVLRRCGVASPYIDSQPLTIEDVQLDPPRPSELVVKIAGAGLCHSDLSVINGTRPRPVPLVLGHEGSGEVVEIGSAITDIRVGDHVVFQFSPSCGRCRRCLEGRPQICETGAETKAKGHLMAGGVRIKSMQGEEIGHHTGVSCMAEFAVTDRGSAVVIDAMLDLRDAALFGCAVITGVGAVINTARIRPGDTVAIIGLGGVGLSGVMGAKLAGAGQIIAIDIDEARLSLAKQLGATDAYHGADADCVEQVRELTKGGVDFAIDLAGVIPALQTAYRVTRYGGTVITAGLSPASAEFSFNQGDLVAQEKSIRGSYMGSCVPVRDIPRLIDLYQQGRLPVDRLIDSYIPIEELNAGFDRLNSGQALRQIMVPNG